MKSDRTGYRWDPWSDQPATLDRRAKGKLRRSGIRDEPRKWLACLASMPAILKTLRARRPFEAYHNDDRIGLCINPDRGFEGRKPVSAAEIGELIRPLHLSRLAIRVPLHDLGRIEEYVEFVRSFPQYEILVMILQDREFVEDRKKLEATLDRIFSALTGVVARYQIGNAVNRLKWGFVSQREYLEFFQVAWELRNRRYPDLELLGGAVIDFELHEHCGALFHPLPFRYDGYASLLYVDRRGAPENRQLGFDLLGKIEVLRRLAAASDKLPLRRKAPPLWITEVNWPLLDTGRYAPSLDDCRVGESEQLTFLVRYFLLVLASGAVSAGYWHQLVAPGYGLIDNRDGVLRERPAFRGFSTLCRLFNGADVESFEREADLGYYRLTARKGGAEVAALWRSGGEASIPMPPGKRAIGIEGEALALEAGEAVTIGDSVIYLIDG